MALKNLVRKKLDKQLYRSTYSRAFFTLYGVVIKEISVSFKQFYTVKYPISSLFRVMGLIFSSLVRLMLGRSVKYSFAFTGEDLLLNSIYKPLITCNGFYVDVGCNHPVFLSNTYLLYRKGWRGICIDANSELIKKYAFFRPGDRAVQALVSDIQQERDFYLSENDVLSTTEETNLESFKKEGLSFTANRYTTRSLTSILEECEAPKEIDILSIDVEKHDFSVLQSLDFTKYRPKLIILEDEFDIRSYQSNPLYKFMIHNGYELIGFILKNVYFKRLTVDQ